MSPLIALGGLNRFMRSAAVWIAVGAGLLARAPAPAQEAVILTEPASWKLETMPIPPTFAPKIPLKGREEVRFSPGMFKTESPTYFTYLIAITADRAPKLDAAEVKRFLEMYFRGLATVGGNEVTAEQRQEMMANVTEPMVAARKDRRAFNATMVMFDPFHGGQKVTLNIEGSVVPRPATKQTCLILMISPSAPDSEVWKSLRVIGEQAVVKAAS